MGFLDDLVSRSVPKELAPTLFRAVICGGRSAYVENVKEIKKFTKEEIVLVLKTGRLVLRGENLSVTSFSAGDLTVSGKVEELSVKEKES